MLGAQVVGHEAIVPAERGRGGRDRLLAAQRERGQVEAAGPALGARVEPLGVALRDLDVRLREQRPGVRVVEGEVVAAELEQLAADPHARQRHGALAAPREHEQRAGRQLPCEGAQRVDALPGDELVVVVEHHDDAAGRGRERRAEPRHGARPDARPRGAQGREHAGVDRRGAVDRGREVRQEHDRIVVVAVERQPRERARVDRGPLRQDDRLAVAGRRGDPHDPRDLLAAQALHEGGTCHETVARSRDGELRLVDRQGRSYSAAIR